MLIGYIWLFIFVELLMPSGGGVWGVFLTSVLMLMFWPTGWVMLRRLRIKLNHPSRTSRFPNVGESAMSSGVPLLCLSLYLGTQSLSCLVYEGVTDCTLKNSGKLEGGRIWGGGGLSEYEEALLDLKGRFHNLRLTVLILICDQYIQYFWVDLKCFDNRSSKA